MIGSYLHHLLYLSTRRKNLSLFLSVRQFSKWLLMTMALLKVFTKYYSSSIRISASGF